MFVLMFVKLDNAGLNSFGEWTILFFATKIHIIIPRLLFSSVYKYYVHSGAIIIILQKIL